MIRIRIIIGFDSCILNLVATGHAPRNGSSSLPCGIVSALLRSFGLWSLDQADFHAAGRIDQEGHFEVSLAPSNEQARNTLRGASLFLIQGLGDVKSTAPDSIQLILENSEEKYNGT